MLKNDRELETVIKEHFERREQRKGAADRFFQRKAKREGWASTKQKKA